MEETLESLREWMIMTDMQSCSFLVMSVYCQREMGADGEITG